MSITVRNFIECGPLSLRFLGKRFNDDEPPKDYMGKAYSGKDKGTMVTVVPSSNNIFLVDTYGHQTVDEATITRPLGKLLTLRRKIAKIKDQ